MSNRLTVEEIEKIIRAWGGIAPNIVAGMIDRGRNLKGVDFEEGYEFYDRVPNGLGKMFPKLRYLNFGNCDIYDISFLADCAGSLKELWLQNTNVECLDVLKDFDLEMLAIDRTCIVSLEPLKEMKSLKKLYLSGTGVFGLSPLSGLRLKELDLQDCKRVSDLSPLFGMDFEYIYLAGTKFEKDGWEKLKFMNEHPDQIGLLKKKKAFAQSPLSKGRKMA